MAYTTINKSTDYFNTKLYTGNGSTQSITGVGFQPDWTWIKSRSNTYSNVLIDAVRGVGTTISSNSGNAAYSSPTEITSFDSDGFTLGTDAGVNNNASTFVSWNWKANGAGSANTDGSINTDSTSVNTTAGFSICKWTGTGSNATIGHGLGVAPKMIIVKNVSTSDSWNVYHESIGNGKRLFLDTTGAESSTSDAWNDTTPTSSVFSIGTNTGTNGSGNTLIAYCFAEKVGYSKFNAYVGNGSTNGSFTYTGFKPAFVMVKYASPGGGVGNWGIFDSVRNPTNVVDKGLLANTNAAEDTSDFIDIVSNGFKQKSTSSNRNEDGSTYVYMAFAEHPFVANVGGGLPTTAR